MAGSGDGRQSMGAGSGRSSHHRALAGQSRAVPAALAPCARSASGADKSPKHETAERLPRARKQRKKVGPPRGPAPPTDVPGGATGWSMSGAEPDRKKISQPHGGALTPHAPGSNGG